MSALNSHDIDENAALLDDGFQLDRPSGPMNKEQILHKARALFQAFPDLRLGITLSVAHDDMVLAHWTATGRQQGTLTFESGKTLPATGHAININGASTMQVLQDKVVKGWLFFDMLTLFQQLGVLGAI